MLTKSGFIDYSLFMIVVLRPFKHVEHFQPSALGVSQFEDVQGADSEAPSTKRLFIGDVHQQLILLMEQTRYRSKVFHNICDAYDCATIRAWKDLEENAGFFRRVQTAEEAKGRSSEAGLIIEDSNPLAKLQSPAKPHHMPGSPQVINFIRNTLSYEFASKYMDATDGVGAVGKGKARNQMDPHE